MSVTFYEVKDNVTGALQQWTLSAVIDHVNRRLTTNPDYNGKPLYDQTNWIDGWAQIPEPHEFTLDWVSLLDDDDEKEYVRQDNRVCLFYVTQRLKDILDTDTNGGKETALKKFHEECTYNLGVNALHNHHVGDEEAC